MAICLGRIDSCSLANTLTKRVGHHTRRDSHHAAIHVRKRVAVCTRNAALDANRNQVELDLGYGRLSLVAKVYDRLELGVIRVIHQCSVVKLAAIKPLVIHVHVKLVLNTPALAHHIADLVIHLDLDHVNLVATELDAKTVLVIVRVHAVSFHKASIVLQLFDFFGHAILDQLVQEITCSKGNRATLQVSHEVH